METNKGTHTMMMKTLDMIGGAVVLVASIAVPFALYFYGII